MCRIYDKLCYNRSNFLLFVFISEIKLSYYQVVFLTKILCSSKEIQLISEFLYETHKAPTCICILLWYCVPDLRRQIFHQKKTLWMQIGRTPPSLFDIISCPVCSPADCKGRAQWTARCISNALLPPVLLEWKLQQEQAGPDDAEMTDIHDPLWWKIVRPCLNASFMEYCT